MPGSKPQRHGSITPLAIISLLILLAALAVAVDYIFLWQTRVEMQAAADAASAASANALVSEDQLKGDPAKIAPLFQNARDNAVLYGRLNRVLGQPVQFNPNYPDLVNGDILFGTLDNPKATMFVPASNTLDPFNSALAQVNAVRVISRHTQAHGNPVGVPLGGLLLTSNMDVVAASTAMLDRDVIGFQFRNHQPLPLAPIALLSDQQAEDPFSWEYLVEAGNGPDQYRFDKGTNSYVADPLGDGIHEFAVTLAPPGKSPPAQTNGVLLQFGSATTVSEQLANGLTPTDLQGEGGQLVLGPNNTILLPGSPTTPASGYADIQAALTQLQQTAAVRVWPLYTTSDPATGVTTVHGFVAARVVQVTATAGGPLTFILQATMIAVPDAVTDFTRRGVGGVNITNPYVVKIRFVQ